MTRHKARPESWKGLSVKASRATRRLRNTIMFAAARGAATATGSGLVALTYWWITHH
jgi:hypothetical protein